MSDCECKAGSDWGCLLWFVVFWILFQGCQIADDVRVIKRRVTEQAEVKP